MKYLPGDIVYVYGITDPRRNELCRGVVHHEFIGHYSNDIEYAIAVDILDGDFIVRSPGCIWGTVEGYHGTRESQEFDLDWLKQRNIIRN